MAKKVELVKFLKASGFEQHRNGQKHEIWMRGQKVMTVSYGRHIKDRSFKNYVQQIKRAD